jgi:hypothetical protein
VLRRQFEVIVGKSIPTTRQPKCFGFVSRLDAKPKRRLYDMLASQSLQTNQQLVFSPTAATPFAISRCA